jgi:arylsulfatase A-like enzyme
VLVSIDTLRADHVGAYGGAAQTPVMDALADEGVRFATAISPTPITLPSHASLLTGLIPPRHGVRNNATFHLPSDVGTLAERMQESGFATAGFVGAMVLDRQYGLDRGFDHYDDWMSPRLAAGRTGYPERTADQVVDSALAWLEQAPPRFFLWVHFYDPHSAYKAPARFRRAHPRSPYDAEIAFVDHELGRLLRAVYERGRSETLVAVTSDHGEALGEHDELTHSLTIYDATQRVPLLVRGPGVPRGRVVDTPVQLVDVAPTILALAGLAPLDQPDGRDLVPVMYGDPGTPRSAYIETLATQMEMGWSPLLGLRSANYKYIRAPRSELYDLSLDPTESRDVRKAQASVAARLDRELDAILHRGRPVQPTLTPNAESQALLESLGYATVSPGGVRFGLGRVGGTDPKDGLAQLSNLWQARAEARESGSLEAIAKLAAIEGGGFFRAQLGAEVALEIGDAAAAENFGRATVRAAPEFWESHVTLGRALLLAGRLDEAQRSFASAVALDGAAADPLVGIGRIAEARGELDRARVLYEQARERRGNSAEALWRLAALHIEAGEAEPARALLADVPVAVMQHAPTALRLARAEAKRGLVDEARSRLDDALRETPAHRALLAARAAL